MTWFSYNNIHDIFEQLANLFSYSQNKIPKLNSEFDLFYMQNLSLLQKLVQRREGSSHLAPEDKLKADQILTLDFMSSDEDGEGDVRDVRVLSWESIELRKIKKLMDTRFWENASPAQRCAIHATRKVRGIGSSRTVPKGAPAWTVKQL